MSAGGLCSFHFDHLLLMSIINVFIICVDSAATFTAKWTSPEEDETKMYKVQCTKSSSTSITTTTAATSEAFFVGDVKPGEEVTLRVKPVCSNGDEGHWSEAVKYSVPECHCKSNSILVYWCRKAVITE